MSDKIQRRPFSNFFIKKSMQLSIIGKILFVVILSTIITTIFIAYAYNTKSQAGNFYYMSNDIMEDLKLESILSLVLPALIVAQIVSLFIAIGIGLFSSRIAAVPVYKIEKWAAQLKNGNLKTRLAFRETKKMQELTNECNGVADRFRELFTAFNTSVKTIETNADNPAAIKEETRKLNEQLSTLQFD